MKGHKYLLFGAAVSASLMLGQIVLAQAPVLDSSENYTEPMNVSGQNTSNYYPSSRPVARHTAPQTPQSNEAVYLLSKINELQQEIQKLRGQLEVQAHDLKLLNRQQTAFYSDLDQRLASITTATPTLAASVSDTPSAVVVAPVVEQIPTVSEEDAYTAAYAQIQKRDFTQAVQQMSDFLAQYPSSRYAGNAHYWLGELYFAENDLDKSNVDFNTVLQNYPQSNKIAASLLKLGFAYHQQGKINLARSELEKVTSGYPNSSAAHLASARLKEIAESPLTTT